MVMEIENIDSIRHGKVLADFYSTTCAPCKAMNPFLEEISTEFPDIKVAKIDVTKNPVATQMFGVMSVPTVVFMQDYAVKEVSRGYSDKAHIRSMIKKHI